MEVNIETPDPAALHSELNQILASPEATLRAFADPARVVKIFEAMNTLILSLKEPEKLSKVEAILERHDQDIESISAVFSKVKAELEPKLHKLSTPQRCVPNLQSGARKQVTKTLNRFFEVEKGDKIEFYAYASADSSTPDLIGQATCTEVQSVTFDQTASDQGMLLFTTVDGNRLTVEQEEAYAQAEGLTGRQQLHESLMKQQCESNLFPINGQVIHWDAFTAHTVEGG